MDVEIQSLPILHKCINSTPFKKKESKCSSNAFGFLFVADILAAFYLSLVYIYVWIVINYAYIIYQFVNEIMSGNNYVLLYIFSYFLA